MWAALYVASIVLVNWMFTSIAPWSTPLGDLYLANIVVGFIFVLRDYAQREIGHSILLATALGGRAHLVHGGPGDCRGLDHRLHPV